MTERRRRYVDTDERRVPLAALQPTEVRLPDLIGAIDRLELAAIAHNTAERSGDERHQAITKERLHLARSEVAEMARVACEGTAELNQVLRAVYDHMMTHDGRRLAVKLRPWLRG